MCCVVFSYAPMAHGFRCWLLRLLWPWHHHSYHSLDLAVAAAVQCYDAVVVASGGASSDAVVPWSESSPVRFGLRESRVRSDAHHTAYTRRCSAESYFSVSKYDPDIKSFIIFSNWRAVYLEERIALCPHNVHYSIRRYAYKWNCGDWPTDAMRPWRIFVFAVVISRRLVVD